MNILIINYEFPPLGGGGGIFSYHLAKELAKEHSVDVLTSSFTGLAKMEKMDGITVHRVKVLNRTSLYHATMISMLTFPASATLKGLGLIREKKYDVINTHFAVPSGPAGIALSFFSGVPNVLSLHGSDIYNPVKKTSPHKHAVLRWAVRLALKKAAAVVAQSTAIKRRAEGIYSPGREIKIVPLGMEETNFAVSERSGLPVEKDKFCVVSMGRMDKIKGYDYLIKAADILNKKGEEVYFIFIGDGPEREKLAELAHSLGLSEKVKFTGWLSGEEKFKRLAASDLYVMSSIHEGFGVVLLEAMRSGLPIVSTNEGGQTDIIEDGKGGILVPPKNSSALAEAIIKLKKNPTLRKAMSECNKNKVNEFSISVTAKRYLEIFNECISKKPD